MDGSEIRTALELGEFELRFSPRVALCDGRVDCMEALLAPSGLTARANACGLGAELGWQIVAGTVSALLLWTDYGFRPRVCLPMPRGALAARAHMSAFAALNGVGEERLFCADEPQVLTIDAAMMEQALESHRARKSLGASLEKAHAAGMVSSAQGVSTLLHWELLRELGCGYASGDFIAPRRLAHDVPEALCTWGERYAALSAVYELQMGI
jgi:EAL domain-containing protein (putative c-di-GMP-specific phosphodiesterase class I)